MGKRIIAALFSVLLAYQPVAGAAELNYDTEIINIKNYISASEFEKAEELTMDLLQSYPGNAELLGILAKLHYWQNEYNESIAAYNRLLEVNNTEENRQLLEDVRDARELSELKALKSELSSAEYEEKLLAVYNSSSDKYNSGHLLGMYYFENRRFDQAAELYGELIEQYPDEKNFRILQMEAYLENKNYLAANTIYDEIYENEEEFTYLTENRSDLPYRLQNNYLKLEGGYYNYSGNVPNERLVSLELSQRLADTNLTLVPRFNNISRFGLNDNQLGLDLYTRFGDKTWGYLTGNFSPDAEFLPVWSAGTEIFHGINDLELSMGYTRMNFSTQGVNIVKPGFIYYLPFRLSIAEKLYFIPEQLAATLVSTLNYEPSHKFNVFYSFGFGQIAERMFTAQDIQKFPTYSHTLGFKYRFIPELSINSEFLYNHRGGLYDITGLSVYTRYWW